jgi:alanine racemase
MTLRPRARIHLDHIVDNWRRFCAMRPRRETAAVVKADAYGHGLPKVSEALYDAGCQHFFVAYSFEGLAVRQAVGPHAVIYVLNGPDAYDDVIFRDAALTPVINSDQQFQILVSWIQAGGALPRGYALHFDTGMNRLGLPCSDAGSISEAAAQLPPALIMSHLACADQPEAGLNTTQLDRFHDVSALFPNVPTSLEASDGLFLDERFQSHLARPGICLYGGGRPPSHLSLQAGMTLEAPILQVRACRAHETIGYGASHKLATDTLVATVALGYADGFPRSASKAGYAMIDGVSCPILGRVSMDLITLNVSAVPHLARPGHFAQFFGTDLPLEDQAERAGTIGYELTAGLTARVRREYD